MVLLRTATPRAITLRTVILGITRRIVRMIVGVVVKRVLGQVIVDIVLKRRAIVIRFIIIRAAQQDGIVVDDEPATMALATWRREGLNQAPAQPLTGDLNKAQGRHFTQLMAGSVLGQSFTEPAEHQFLVFFQHHVDEVDDDHAADVTQPHLTDDLVSGFEVVAGHGFFEAAARAGETAGVDVNDRHGLGFLNDKRASGRQEHHAIQRLFQLLIKAPVAERILPLMVLTLVLRQFLFQVRRNAVDVRRHHRPRAVTVDNKLIEVFVEEVTHNLDQQIRLFMQCLRAIKVRLRPLLATLRILLPGTCPGGHLRARQSTEFVSFLKDRVPHILLPTNITSDILGIDTLRGRADNRTTLIRQNSGNRFLQTLPFGLRELTRHPVRTPFGHVHQVPTRQRNVAGKPWPLVPDGILRDLNQNRITRLECFFDLPLTAGVPSVPPINISGVNHTVAIGPDIDERGFHAGQDVLDSP